MQKPLPYDIYRVGNSGNRQLVLQTRGIKTGEALSAVDLTAYRVLQPIGTPWFGITIGKGSRMLLADDAAAPLIESGQIEPILSAPLVPWRQGYDARSQARYDAKQEAKKTFAGRTGS